LLLTRINLLDATETVPQYIVEHPETIVALAYFDMQIYEPTRAALAAIKPYLTKGSVIAMELNCPELPGETQAFGTQGVCLRRS
jgi:hypothetical protein